MNTPDFFIFLEEIIKKRMPSDIIHFKFSYLQQKGLFLLLKKELAVHSSVCMTNAVGKHAKNKLHIRRIFQFTGIWRYT
jgi:hypothetical protein